RLARSRTSHSQIVCLPAWSIPSIAISLPRSHSTLVPPAITSRTDDATRRRSCAAMPPNRLGSGLDSGGGHLCPRGPAWRGPCWCSVLARWVRTAGRGRMKRAGLQELTSTSIDLLVVGGGIVGCGIARDAALRGLQVALIEREDLGAGTTSRSTRLIHG